MRIFVNFLQWSSFEKIVMNIRKENPLCFTSLHKTVKRIAAQVSKMNILWFYGSEIRKYVWLKHSNFSNGLLGFSRVEDPKCSIL